MAKIVKYKCSLCYYEAFNRENLEKHISSTKKCSEATILELEIKCSFCDKIFPTEISKVGHEKICKIRKLEEELLGLSIEEQNKVLERKYNEQNKHIELVEKQLRMIKYKFAREEEVNNMAMDNEHGLSVNELHNYCLFTLKRLFEELTLPAITTNIDIIKKKEAEEAEAKANDPKEKEQEQEKEQDHPKTTTAKTKSTKPKTTKPKILNQDQDQD